MPKSECTTICSCSSLTSCLKQTLVMCGGLAMLPPGRVSFKADDINKTYFWDGTPSCAKKKVLVDFFYSLTFWFYSFVLTCFSICSGLEGCNFTANLTMSSVGLSCLHRMIQFWRKGKNTATHPPPPPLFPIDIQSRQVKKKNNLTIIAKFSLYFRPSHIQPVNFLSNHF